MRASLTELDRKVESMEKTMNINHVEMKGIVGKLEGSLSELDGKVEAMQKKMENSHVEEKMIVGKLEGSLVGMKKRVNEKVEALKDCHDKIKRDQCEVRNEVKERSKVKKEVKDVKENLSKVNKDVNEVIVMMCQMLEKSSTVELMNKLPSLTEDMLKTPRENILTASGFACHSAKIFSWEMSDWYEVAPVNQVHSGSSSFITISFLLLAVVPRRWRPWIPMNCL